MSPKTRASRRGEGGMSFADVLVTAAILGLCTITAAEALGRQLERSALKGLATTFHALVVEASSTAVIRRRNTGLLFRRGPSGVTAQLYVDGDRDGLSLSDIRDGTDRAISSPIPLGQGAAEPGLPSGLERDPFGKSLTGQDPIRFGPADLLSFTPHGTATPGTLYARDASGQEGWAFRVAGIDGRVRVYRWWRGSWTEIARW
ncbi:MAG: pilus assembly FimT family protein [Acidobacteriota bacterium]